MPDVDGLDRAFHDAVPGEVELLKLVIEMGDLPDVGLPDDLPEFVVVVFAVGRDIRVEIWIGFASSLTFASPECHLNADALKCNPARARSKVNSVMVTSRPEAPARTSPRSLVAFNE